MADNKSNNGIEAGKPVANCDLLPETVDIQPLIRIIRGQHVMLDRDLAVLYRVETRVLNQAVKHNLERFPEDFMFQLTKEEFENWKSQFVTSKSIIMGARKLPYAFTEQGIAMLSSVLKSQTAELLRDAIEVNPHSGDTTKIKADIPMLQLVVRLHLLQVGSINSHL